MKPPPVAVLAAAERRRRGLPDARDREPGAAEGWRWWPSIEGPPADLLQLAEFAAAVREGEDQAIGVAIPGAPGACSTCHHGRIWHRMARWACEAGCDCRAFARPPAAQPALAAR